MMHFQWGWCELCKSSFIRCPKCGNNCCNGGRGTLDNGEKCNICDLSYEYQYLGWDTKQHPQNKTEVTYWNNKVLGI